MFSKKEQAGRYSRKKQVEKIKLKIPESCNQKFANEYLELKKIKNIRIPDSVWSSLHFKNQRIKMLLAKGETNNGLAGIADNTCFIKISDKYSLALHLELKSTDGKLSGKAQKENAKELPYQIAKSPEDVIEIVDNFIKTAEDFKKMFKI